MQLSSTEYDRIKADRSEAVFLANESMYRLAHGSMYRLQFMIAFLLEKNEQLRYQLAAKASNERV